MRSAIQVLTLSALLLSPRPAPAKSSAPGSVILERQTFHLKGLADKKAVIHAPVVKGIPDERLRSRIQDAIGLKAGTDNSLEEWKAEFQESWWLTEIVYEVRYNRNFLLDVIYTVSGAGAYPDSHAKSLVVDLRTGKRLAAADLFKRSSLEKLAERLNRDLKADVETTRRKWGHDWDSVDEEVRTARFDAGNLDAFTLDERGVIFRYDFGFSHVVKAMEPGGSYLLTWKELAPFIDEHRLKWIVIRDSTRKKR